MGSVIDLVCGGEVERECLLRDRRGHRIDGNRIVTSTGTGQLVIDRYGLVGSDVLIGERSRNDLDREIVAIILAGESGKRCIGGGGSIVSFVLGTERKGQFGGRDRQIGFAVPVGVIGAAHFRVNGIGTRVGKDGSFGQVVGNPVERINCGFPFNRSDGDRTPSAVVGDGRAVKFGSELGRRNRAAEGLCTEFKHVIRARRAVERVGCRHGFVRTDVGIAKLAGSSHGNPPEIGIGNA